MSAPYIIPFNFQPESIAVRTSSYTIPAGKYARVVVHLEGASSFSINGSVALNCNQNSVLASDNLKLGDSGSGAAVGALYTFTTAGTVNAAGGAFNEAQDVKVISAEYWMPSGSSLSGSGSWRAVVTEYSNIS